MKPGWVINLHTTFDGLERYETEIDDRRRYESAKIDAGSKQDPKEIEP